MDIGIIDADFIGRRNHRFPNLACMKIAGYHVGRGDQVNLLEGYENIESYDKVYVSKVFTDTKIPSSALEHDNVSCGGTGFKYDDADPLPNEIEHTMPYYDLYKNYVGAGAQWKFYRDYSVGFTTRGCFRHCQFCVNRNSDRSYRHSKLDEFVDDRRKKICLLDDNVLACSEWREIFEELQATGKTFVYKQGLDERLLTQEKCDVIFNSKYDGEFIFAFDDVNESDLIIEKLKMIRKNTDRACKFFLLCGYDRRGAYDHLFWENDIVDLFRRIEILIAFGCLPYVMRHENYKNSPYRGMYVNIARWCNQPSIFKKMSFLEFCEHPQNYESSCGRYFRDYMAEQSYMQDKYLSMRFDGN